MGIILIILGALGWIININGWFAVPVLLYKGLIVGGIVWQVIVILIHIITMNKFDRF